MNLIAECNLFVLRIWETTPWLGCTAGDKTSDVCMNVTTLLTRSEGCIISVDSIASHGGAGVWSRVPLPEQTGWERGALERAVRPLLVPGVCSFSLRCGHLLTMQWTPIKHSWKNILRKQQKFQSFTYIWWFWPLLTLDCSECFCPAPQYTEQSQETGKWCRQPLCYQQVQDNTPWWDYQ